MSDLHDELEQQFASADKQSEELANVNEAAEQTQATPAEVDEWMNAPAAYTNEFKEKFKTWPQEARKQIIEREKQVERGFSDFGNKINAYKYIDDAFNGRQERLKQGGYNSAKEWIEGLAQIDDAFAENPQATLKALAQYYGINPTANENNNANNELENKVNRLQALVTQQQQAAMQKQVDDFVNAKDDAGQAKHPYFEDVRQEMAALLGKGICQTLEEAYEKCIWANESVRDKLIASKQAADLAAKANEAEKKKQAGFTPQSKSEVPEKDLTLREELERQFDAMG